MLFENLIPLIYPIAEFVAEFLDFFRVDEMASIKFSFSIFVEKSSFYELYCFYW